MLEDVCEVLIVNAQHIKGLPGRKTDVGDAEWIADLLQHGALRVSYIPTRAQREVRDLTRHRSTLVEERARVVNRLQKVLEDANIKLAGVATDIMGASARDMLAAIIGGETNAERLADLARGCLRAKHDQLAQALAGRVRPHHRFLLAAHLGHITYLEGAIDRLSQEITLPRLRWSVCGRRPCGGWAARP